MRVLKNEELKAVSGGTFCLLGGLLRGVFSLFSCGSSRSSHGGGDKGGKGC
jgi:hypothetical protein